MTVSNEIKEEVLKELDLPRPHKFFFFIISCFQYFSKLDQLTQFQTEFNTVFV